jgi:predicted dehydrogenase
MKDHSAAVIGLGYWGPKILKNLIELDRFSPIYCFDIDGEKVTRSRKKFPSVKAVKNYEEIIENEDIKCIFICTPADSHFDLARMALKKGKDLFVEKPFTRDVRQALELIRLAEKKSLKLMVGHTFEFSPEVNKIKEIIEDGVLGEIFFITSTRTNFGIYRDDINVISDLAVHDFSILFKLLSEYPSMVSAFSNSYIKDGLKDAAFINLKYRSGPMANIIISWLSPRKIREMTIVGSKKMLVYDDTSSGKKIRIFNKSIGLQNSENNSGKLDFKYNTTDIVESPSLEKIEPLKLEVSHFLNCVKNNINPQTDGYNALKVMKMIGAVERSAEKNGEVVHLNEKYWDA